MPKLFLDDLDYPTVQLRVFKLNNEVTLLLGKCGYSYVKSRLRPLNYKVANHEKKLSLPRWEQLKTLEEDPIPDIDLDSFKQASLLTRAIETGNYIYVMDKLHRTDINRLERRGYIEVDRSGEFWSYRIKND
jgi:hypothetical protein